MRLSFPPLFKGHNGGKGMKKILVLTLNPICSRIVHNHRGNTTFLDLSGDEKNLQTLMDNTQHVLENYYDTVVVEKDLFKYMTPEFEEQSFINKPTRFISFSFQD